MSELGRHPVREEQVIELISAMQLIKPFCVTDPNTGALEYSYREGGLETQFVVDVDEAGDGAAAFCEVFGQPSPEEFDELATKTNMYRLTRTKIVEEASGMLIETRQQHSIITLADGTPFDTVPGIDEQIHVSSDKGITWVRARSLIEQKKHELFISIEEGNRIKSSALSAEIDALELRNREFERLTGERGDYNQAEHVKLMGYVHTIHKRLGIDTDSSE